MDVLQIKIIVPLVAAHFLSDFVLQTDSDVKQKNKVKVFIKHIFFVTGVSYLFLGLFDNYLIPIVILITHSSIDLIKLKIKKDEVYNSYFSIDECSSHNWISYYCKINFKICRD